MTNLIVTINAYIIHMISIVGMNKETEEMNILGILLVGLYIIIAGTLMAAMIITVLAFIFYLPFIVFMYE